MRRATATLLMVVLALTVRLPALSTSASEPIWVWVEIHRKALTVYRGREALYTCAIATGRYDTPTPIGTYRVSSRFAGEMSGFGTCFLGLNVPWGQFGLHGTNKPGSIGSNASHGCVRMLVKDAETVYRMVPNGSKVVLEGGPYGLLDTSLRPVFAGERGNHVAAIQNRLRQLGYYEGHTDGIYGQGTVAAVRKARRVLQLRDSENVDYAFYKAIGLILFE